MPSFEFDETKSQANFAKHGINFIDAQLLWQAPGLLEIPAKTEDEPRYLVIGLLTATQIFDLFPFVDHGLMR
ncbi:MAG TPA: BrnT family toxin [Burkholderiales bacterium]|nr:BrnT family toxin [Burkholderiales bacterium]